MMRDEFYLWKVAQYLREGMDLGAARNMASAVTFTHFPLSELGSDAFQKDHDEEREGLTR